MVLLLPTAQGDFSPFFGNFLKIFSFSKILTFPLFFIPLMRGVCLSSLRLFKISFFPFDAGGGSFLSFLPFFKILIFPSTRSGRAGPLLSAPAESRQRQAQGSFTPLRIPGPKWGAGRPPLETPKSSLARQTWPNSSPLRGWSFGAIGEGRERLRARHDCRTSTASFGGFAPLPPAFPVRERPTVTHLFWGLRPLTPAFPSGERLPVMRACFRGLRPLTPAFPVGKSLPIMRASAWYHVR